MEYNVSVFTPYEFKTGQKIRIEGSRRGGDWEVIDCSDTKVTLRCPVSHKTVVWDRFCYHTCDKQDCWPSDRPTAGHGQNSKGEKS